VLLRYRICHTTQQARTTTRIDKSPHDDTHKSSRLTTLLRPVDNLPILTHYPIPQQALLRLLDRRLLATINEVESPQLRLLPPPRRLLALLIHIPGQIVRKEPMRNEHDLLLVPVPDETAELCSAGIESFWINSVLAFVEVPAMLYMVEEDNVREFFAEDVDWTAVSQGSSEASSAMGRARIFWPRAMLGAKERTQVCSALRKGEASSRSICVSLYQWRTGHTCAGGSTDFVMRLEGFASLGALVFAVLCQRCIADTLSVFVDGGRVLALAVAHDV